MYSVKVTIVLQLVFLMLLAHSHANAGQLPLPPNSAPAVELHCGTQSQLSGESSAALKMRALQLLTSSQFNSDGPDWHFPLSEVQQEYSAAQASDYLRITLPTVEQIKTQGGTVSARRILVRLSPHVADARSRYPDHFVDSLFSIDAAGRQTGHALYSGTAFYQLLAVIADIPNNECRIPTRAQIRQVLDRAGLTP